jgi:hypothetical protein
MSDKKKSMIVTQDNMVNIALSEPEIKALLDVLQLAQSAARILANTEMAKGTATAAARMNRVASDANELMRIIAESARIGEPLTEERH